MQKKLRKTTFFDVFVYNILLTVKLFDFFKKKNLSSKGSVWSVGLTITTICAVAILVACLAGLITAVLNSRKQHAIEEKALLLRPKAQKAQFTESAIEWDDSVKSDSSTEMAMSTDI
ncbi:hypothetical protein AB6A40_006359 [Gnathostoma spinigerum]|uniref:Uncharacterized protein n=1 Tax=Gnathostoma spinigerum TaxID=75299 RepID=A0ABD6ETT4_9BILA